MTPAGEKKMLALMAKMEKTLNEIMRILESMGEPLRMTTSGEGSSGEGSSGEGKVVLADGRSTWPLGPPLMTEDERDYWHIDPLTDEPDPEPPAESFTR